MFHLDKIATDEELNLVADVGVIMAHSGTKEKHFIFHKFLVVWNCKAFNYLFFRFPSDLFGLPEYRPELRLKCRFSKKKG